MAKRQKLAQLSVWLNQTLVGSITELPNDRNLFAFERDYMEDHHRPVLSFSYKDAEGGLIAHSVETQMRVPPFFSNLLPEDELRRYVALRAGVKSVRDLPLLQLLGEDLPGAVIVRPESEGPPPALFEAEEVPSTTVKDENKPLRFSLAGVQMKFSASGSPQQRLTIPVEGRGGHWILKLPSARFPLVPENEHSMMQFARSVGINTADSGLVPIEEVEGLPETFRREQGNALWVKRFDRTAENARVHMEDFNQLYRQFPEEKYKNFSYGNMAIDLAHVVGLQAVEEFVRRLVFSAAIGNADMHLKNWSILYPDGRTPELAPAYDLVSTIAYIEDFEMALSVAKEKDIRNFDVDLLKRFVARIPVPGKPLMDVALATAENITRGWPAFRESLEMSAEAQSRVADRIRAFPLTAMFN